MQGWVGDTDSQFGLDLIVSGMWLRTRTLVRRLMGVYRGSIIL